MPPSYNSNRTLPVHLDRLIQPRDSTEVDERFAVTSMSHGTSPMPPMRVDTICLTGLDKQDMRHHCNLWKSFPSSKQRHQAQETPGPGDLRGDGGEAQGRAQRNAGKAWAVPGLRSRTPLPRKSISTSDDHHSSLFITHHHHHHRPRESGCCMQASVPVTANSNSTSTDCCSAPQPGLHLQRWPG